MKTAISIPDPVFEDAEKLAGNLGVSRSELYARAVRAYVDVHVREHVTEALDRVYAEVDSRTDPILTAMQLAGLAAEDW